MSLCGTLSTMTLPDLLQWLHSCAKTGTLSVRGERFVKRIYFQKGEIVSSASEDPTEYLGQFLLSHDAITEEDLKHGMEVQEQTGVLLGKILTMVGTLTEEDLKRYLILKAEETVFSLFLWDDAYFEFEEGPVREDNLVPMSLKIDDILLRGLSRYDELKQIKERFGSTLTVVGRNDTSPGSEFLSHPRRRAVWERIDGVRSIADIALELHMAEFLACEMLHLLYQMGHLKVVRRIKPAPPRVGMSGVIRGDPEAEGRKLMKAGKLEEAMDLVERAALEDPQAASTLRALLKEFQDFFVERTYSYHLPAKKIPFLLRPLETLTGERLTPQEGFLISRINGEWTVRDVVTIAPFSEVDALRTLKNLRTREIIDLK